MQSGKLMEWGQLTTLDCDGTKTEYPFALLIEFKSAKDCKRALNEEQCRFASGDYPIEPREKMMDENMIEEKMEEAFEGWKAVQDLERMSIRDVYECAFQHGIEAAQKALSA